MSRYFRYKSAAELEEDALARGLACVRCGDPAELLRPVVVSGRSVGNRMAIQPMEGCDGNLDGTPGELTFRRYRRFGAGGAKLIWGEACAVLPEARANPRQLLINATTAKPLAEMIAECRKSHRDAFGSDCDLLIGLQLTHSGRYSYPRPILAQHDPLLDGRTIIDRRSGTVVTSEYPLISDDELLRLQDRYVDAARLARQIGCDFVDVKQCHRYLLNELLAARSRPGRFGGSFENRTRFGREVVARIRAEVPDLIVASRLNVFDGLPYVKGPDGIGVAVPYEPPVASCWGTAQSAPEQPDLSEPIAYARMLVDAGLAMLNVTLGNPYASPHLLRPFECPPPDGYETPEHPLIGVARHLSLTAQIQRAFPNLAIVGSGYSWLQIFALAVGASAVRDGETTFVGLGRAALSQPDFGQSVMEGRPLDPKRVCRTFSYCTALMRSKHNELGQFATGCPPFDKEAYGDLWKAAQRQAPTASKTVPTIDLEQK